MVSVPGGLGSASLYLTVDSTQLDRGLEISRVRVTNALERLGRDTRLAGFVIGASISAPILGIGAAAVKAQLDFQRAFTGITKFTEGTSAQVNQLEADVRRLARTLPVSIQDISQVAQLGAQFGVPIENLTEFTRVAIDLGNATDIAADKGITGLTRLMAIMGTAPTQVRALADTFSSLKDVGAATGAQTLDTALRISGAGRIIGLTERDVIGLANGIASIVPSAELAGSSFTRVIEEISKAVAEGGSQLRGFARVSDLSVEAFQQLVETNPAQAVLAFVQGLAREREAGQNVFATLKDLNLGNIRSVDALLRVAGASDVVVSSLERVNDVAKTAGATADIATQAYETDAARLQQFFQGLQDDLITTGARLIPALTDIENAAGPAIQGLTDTFSALPPALRDVAIGLGTAGIALGPLVFIVGNFFAVVSPMTRLLTQLPGLLAAWAGSSRKATLDVAAMTEAIRHQAQAEQLLSRQEARTDAIRNTFAAARRNVAARQVIVDPAIIERQRAAEALLIQQQDVAARNRESRQQAAYQALLTRQRATEAGGGSRAQRAAQEALQLQQQAETEAQQRTFRRQREALAERQRIEREVNIASQRQAAADLLARREAARLEADEMRRREENNQLRMRQDADRRIREVRQAGREGLVGAAGTVGGAPTVAQRATGVAVAAVTAEETAAVTTQTAAVTANTAALEARQAALAANARVENLSTAITNADARVQQLSSIAQAQRVAAVQAAAEATRLNIAAKELDRLATEAETSSIVTQGRVTSGQFATRAAREAAIAEAVNLRRTATEAAAAAEAAESQIAVTRNQYLETSTRLQQAEAAATALRRQETVAVAAATDADRISSAAAAAAIEAKAAADEAEAAAEAVRTRATQSAATAQVAETAAVNGSKLAIVGAAGAFLAANANLIILGASIALGVILWRQYQKAVHEAKMEQERSALQTRAETFAPQQLQRDIRSFDEALAGLRARRERLAQALIDTRGFIVTGEFAGSTQKDLKALDDQIEQTQLQHDALTAAQENLQSQSQLTARSLQDLSTATANTADASYGAITWVGDLSDKLKDLTGDAFIAKSAMELLGAVQTPQVPISPQALAGLTEEDAQALIRQRAREPVFNRQEAIAGITAEAIRRYEQELAALQQENDIKNNPRIQQLRAEIDRLKDQGKSGGIDQFVQQRQQQRAQAAFLDLPGLAQARADIQKVLESTASNGDKVSQQFDILDRLWTTEAIPALKALGLAVDTTFRGDFEQAVKDLEALSPRLQARREALDAAAIRDIPGIGGLQQRIAGLAGASGNHVKNLMDQFNLLDKFWTDTAVPALQAAGIALKDGTRQTFEDIANEIANGKNNVRDEIGGLGGIVAALYVRRLSLGLDPGGGLARINTAAITAAGGRGNASILVQQMTVNARPDAQGRITVNNAVQGVKEGFAEAVGNGR